MDMINLAKINKLASQLSEMTNKTWSDFINTTNGTAWLSLPIAGGTITSTGANPFHDGVCEFKSSTNANSGFCISARGYGFYIKGYERTTFIFKTGITITGITRKMGFHDSFDQNDVTNGIYCEIIDGVLRGKTAKSNVRTTTSNFFTLSASTWYRLVIQVNSNATVITYTLYADNSYIVLWEDTVSENIPSSSPSYVSGHGDTCVYSGTTVISLGVLDYADIVLPNRRIV